MHPLLLAALLFSLGPQNPPPTPQEKQEKSKSAADAEIEKLINATEPEKPKEYTLNPKQAEQEIKIGDFYMRKGNSSAAVKRYEEATRWNPKWAVPYLKLGQAYEKKDDPDRAVMAYKKFLEMAPHDKQGKDLPKKIEKLEREAQKED